jgi:hypothetical protein
MGLTKLARREATAQKAGRAERDSERTRQNA